MERISNFREYSIYKTEDGRNLKRGMLYRCGSMHKATSNDLNELEKLNIGYVVDFRSSNESKNNPDRYPNNCEYINVQVNSNEIKKFDQYEGLPGYVKLVPAGSKEAFMESYRQLPFDNPAIKTLFDVLLQNDGRAVLHHCMAGKDRAGTAAAIVLRTLGVSLETIYEDYLKSNEYYNQLLDDIFSDATKEEREKYESYIHYVAIADIDYIIESFKVIDEKYASFDNYLLNEYGIDSIKINILIKKYVEG